MSNEATFLKILRAKERGKPEKRGAWKRKPKPRKLYLGDTDAGRTADYGSSISINSNPFLLPRVVK